jgi:hypothetical protein
MYFLTNAVLVHSAEGNFWTDRQRTAGHAKSGALPAYEGDRSALAQLTETMGIRPSLPSVTAPQTFLLSKLGVKKPSPRLASLAAALSPNGILREIKPAGDNSPIIICIQDIHGHRQAQENISAMILKVLEAVPHAAVGLEGAQEGDIPLGPFRSPSIRANVEAGRFFFNTGYITGAELAAFSAPRSPRYFGLEDKALYLENVAAVRRALPTQTPWLEKIESLKGPLERIKRAELSPALLDLDRKVADYAAGKSGLGRYLSFLAGRHESLGAFRNIERFLRTWAMETALDTKAVERERNKFLSLLIGKLSKSDMQSLLETSVDFRQGRVPYAEYYDHLRRTAAAASVALGGYPRFEKYIRYVLMADSIRAEDLFDEIALLEEAVWNSIPATPRQREIRAMSVDLALAEKLVRLVLTPRDWGMALSRRDALRRLPARLHALLPGWAEALGAFEEFYVKAKARDDALAVNLAKTMKSDPRDVTVMVAGGFHTEGLSRRLAGQGTLLVVSPKVDAVDPKSGNEHLAVFTRDKMPLDKLFESPKITLADTPAIAPIGGGKPAVRQISNELEKLAELRFNGLSPQGEIEHVEGFLVYPTADGPTIIYSPNGKAIPEQIGKGRGRLIVSGVAQEGTYAIYAPFSHRFRVKWWRPIVEEFRDRGLEMYSLATFFLVVVVYTVDADILYFSILMTLIGITMPHNTIQSVKNNDQIRKIATPIWRAHPTYSTKQKGDIFMRFDLYRLYSSATYMMLTFFFFSAVAILGPNLGFGWDQDQIELAALFVSLVLATIPSMLLHIHDNHKYYKNLFLTDSTLPLPGAESSIRNINENLQGVISAVDATLDILDTQWRGLKNDAFWVARGRAPSYHPFSGDSLSPQEYVSLYLTMFKGDVGELVFSMKRILSGSDNSTYLARAYFGNLKSVMMFEMASSIHDQVPIESPDLRGDFEESIKTVSRWVNELEKDMKSIVQNTFADYPYRIDFVEFIQSLSTSDIKKLNPGGEERNLLGYERLACLFLLLQWALGADKYPAHLLSPYTFLDSFRSRIYSRYGGNLKDDYDFEILRLLFHLHIEELMTVYDQVVESMRGEFQSVRSGLQEAIELLSDPKTAEFFGAVVKNEVTEDTPWSNEQGSFIKILGPIWIKWFRTQYPGFDVPSPSFLDLILFLRSMDLTTDESIGMGGLLKSPGSLFPNWALYTLWLAGLVELGFVLFGLFFTGGETGWVQAYISALAVGAGWFGGHVLFAGVFQKRWDVVFSRTVAELGAGTVAVGALAGWVGWTNPVVLVAAIALLFAHYWRNNPYLRHGVYFLLAKLRGTYPKKVKAKNKEALAPTLKEFTPTEPQNELLIHLAGPVESYLTEGFNDQTEAINGRGLLAAQVASLSESSFEGTKIWQLRNLAQIAGAMGFGRGDVVRAFEKLARSYGVVANQGVLDLNTYWEIGHDHAQKAAPSHAKAAAFAAETQQVEAVWVTGLLYENDPETARKTEKLVRDSVARGRDPIYLYRETNGSSSASDYESALARLGVKATMSNIKGVRTDDPRSLVKLDDITKSLSSHDWRLLSVSTEGLDVWTLLNQLILVFENGRLARFSDIIERAGKSEKILSSKA